MVQRARVRGRKPEMEKAPSRSAGLGYEREDRRLKLGAVRPPHNRVLRAQNEEHGDKIAPATAAGYSVAKKTRCQSEWSTQIQAAPTISAAASNMARTAASSRLRRSRVARRWCKSLG
jgi:hypothetical protein